jgi:hypothetical protein
VHIRVSPVRTVFMAALLSLLPSAITATASARSTADTSAVNHTATNNSVSFSSADFESASRGRIEHSVLDLALNAATCAVRSGAVNSPRTLTVIDYSRPSSEKRMWVYDLQTKSLIYEELVAHGQGSGGNVPNAFSNEAETHRTSLGLFSTDTTYVGKNGYSLRLNGLDAGLNDRARDRAIVIHGAPYVSESFVQANGRLGRSWGCPAIRPEIAREMIDRIKGGGLVFAYYPDQGLLQKSKFVTGCGA